MSAVEEDPVRLPMSDAVLAAWEFELSRSHGSDGSTLINWHSIREFIDRIRTAENERDQARRMFCEARASLLTECAEDTTPREICMALWPDQVDRLLFPPEVPT